MMLPYQWDQELADKLLVADPLPSLVQRISQAIARETDRVIREILRAKRPGWTMDQARHSVRLAKIRTSSRTDVYWDGVKLGSYQVVPECAGGGGVKIESTVLIEA
jgi:hypothetical protein